MSEFGVFEVGMFEASYEEIKLQLKFYLAGIRVSLFIFGGHCLLDFFSGAVWVK